MKLYSLLAALIFCVAAVHPAAADSYVYNDPDYGFQMTFPDDWRRQVASGNERLQIGPLHGQDKAECQMSVVRDGRLTLYPEDYLEIASPLTLDQSFWKNEVLPNYKYYQVLKYHAPAGLGPAFASSLQWTWGSVLVGAPIHVTDVNPVGLTPLMGDGGNISPEPGTTATRDTSNVMRAMSIAAIYGNHRYRMTCQSTAAAFEKWQPLFADIFASVKFEAKYAAFPAGFYRDFLSDRPLIQKDYN